MPTAKSAVLRIGGGVQHDPVPTADDIGGKALSLCRMTVNGLPVPPAIVIPCLWTFRYQKDKDAALAELRAEVLMGLSWIDKTMGRPCLYSVRSGAPVSMPGMMDTVLNVGLTDANMPSFNEILGQDGVWDSYRRLMQMYGSVVYGLDSKELHKIHDNNVKVMGAGWETSRSTVKAYRSASSTLDSLCKMSVIDQIMGAVGAVFESWDSERAIEYRKINKLSDKMGTAVTVQAMVYGNLNDQSGSGVLFTRDPSTGAETIFAEYLSNAQGEDVVAGTHTPEKLVIDYPKTKPYGWVPELQAAAQQIEKMYGDMADVEFTVESGKLFILQSRRGKRTPKAAVRIAIDMMKSGGITAKTVRGLLAPDQVYASVGSTIVSSGTASKFATGLACGGGVVRGKVVGTVEQAVEGAKHGPVVLWRPETVPDDLAGMAASVAIVTQKGGATCHAAVVSRAMNKACVVGTGHKGPPNGAMVVVDGDKGEVWMDNGSMKLSEGGDQDLIELATLIAKETGNSMIHERPVPGVPTVIRVCDTVANTALVAEMAKAVYSGADVIVDLTQPEAFCHKDDADVWGLLSPATIQNQWVTVVQALMKNKAKFGQKVSFIVPVGMENDAVFEGLNKIQVARTVKDLFSGSPVMVTGTFVQDVAGDQATYDKLVGVFGSPNLYKPGKTPYELILEAVA